MDQPAPNLDSLAERNRRNGVELRPTLLRAATDLYVAKDRHSPSEERQFTELALRLIDLVDEATRARVAEKLLAYPGTPRAVLARLAGVRGTDEHASAAPPQRAAPLDVFAGQRVSARELEDLFFAADAFERRLILLALDEAAIAPATLPADAAQSVDGLERAALAHNAEAFAQELERALGISRPQARRVAADACGEPILVAAVALGMPEAVLQRILLCLNPSVAQSVQRVYELASLHEEVERASALRLVAIWQAAGRTAREGAPAPAPKPERTPAPRPAPAQADAAGRAAPPSRPRIAWEEHAKHTAGGA